MVEDGIIGIDEAGRGSWAGPLVAAAVCTPRGWEPKEVVDSKQLNTKRRHQCLRHIQATTSHIGIGWVSAAGIDEIGLQAATSRAMSAAIMQIPGFSGCGEIIIDGHIDYLADIVAATPLVRADQSVPAVAAASIVAKCYRDAYMRNISGIYSGYGFERHVGYGTAAHRASMLRYGICDLHRQSFRPVKSVGGK